MLNYRFARIYVALHSKIIKNQKFFVKNWAFYLGIGFRFARTLTAPLESKINSIYVLDVEIETTTPRIETSTITSTTENLLIYSDNSHSTTLEERNFYHQIPSSDNEKSTFAWSRSSTFEESLPVILLIVALQILF